MSGLIEETSDEKLSRAVKEALWRYEPIRSMDLGTIQVEARDGIVVLRGLVSSEAHGFAAVQLARRVSGVKEVVNQLTTDESLERRVAVALAGLERTRRLPITVKVRRGVATLYGAVSSLLDADLARSVAAAVPGVVAVESRVHVLDRKDQVVLAGQGSLEGRPPTRSRDA